MKKIYLYLILIVGLSSCGGGDSNQPSITNDGYDRGALLVNLTDNIIIPSFNQFSNELSDLNQSFQTFSSDLSENNLLDLRKKWLDAYLAWQYVEMFNIGKAEEMYYFQKTNIYPTNTARIELNVESGTYDLENNSNNFSAQGLPAIDYMLYGIESDSNLVITKYQSVDGYKYTNYLSSLINQMISNTNQIINFWQTERDDFVSSTGNTATSSLNKLTNDFIYYYEKGFRANKIGIPGGVFSSVYPDKVEAYYRKNVSKKLALEALKAIKAFYNGESFVDGTSVESLKTYIDFIVSKNNLSNIYLSQQINEKFNNSEQMLLQLNDNFVEQINGNLLQFLYTYDAIQEGVVKLKTDMLSVLSIAVDYVDADGD